MTYAHAFLVPRSRKPVLYTFRALPSIHTANPDTFRQHPSLHLSPFTGYPVLLAPPCSTRSTGLFGAHADPSCIRVIPRERTSKDEHLDHAGCNVPSPSLLLAVTPSPPSSCSRRPIISCKELQPRSKQAKHPHSPTQLPPTRASYSRIELGF